MSAHKVIIAGVDQKILKDMMDKIKSTLDQIPIEFEMVFDGKKLIQEISLVKPIIIIVDWTLPGFAGFQLQQEIQRRVSDVAVLFFGASKPEGLEENIQWMNVPIVNWESFKDLVIDSIPVELRSRYSMEKKSDDLSLKLIEYGKKYVLGTGQKSELKKPILMMPIFYNPDSNNKSVNENKQNDSIGGGSAGISGLPYGESFGGSLRRSNGASLEFDPSNVQKTNADGARVFQSADSDLAGNKIQFILPVHWFYIEVFLFLFWLSATFFSFFSQTISQLEYAVWVQGFFSIISGVAFISLLANKKMSTLLSK